MKTSFENYREMYLEYLETKDKPQTEVLPEDYGFEAYCSQIGEYIKAEGDLTFAQLYAGEATPEQIIQLEKERDFALSSMKW